MRFEIRASLDGMTLSGIDKLSYAATSQMTCLALMARKIMVSQSTSGDVPESGLDVLNQDGDSVEVALARQLVAT